jgi:hypothetical protein
MRFSGSGKTTPEEDQFLESRAKKLYKKYRDWELYLIEQNIKRGGDGILSPTKGTKMTHGADIPIPVMVQGRDRGSKIRS